MNSTTGSIGNFQIQQTVIFKSGSGAPFNGIAPSPASSLGNSFDPEGIVVHPVTGNLVVSDEYGASVYEFTRGGDLVRKYVTPENIKPTTSPGVYNYGPDANSAGRRINRGFEGLAISPDGRYVFAMLQSAMVNEGGANGVFARIVKFDTGTGLAVAQYAYKMKGSSQGRGISALVAINDHEFLVLERNNRGLGSGAELTPQNKKVFKIDLTGAADVGDIVLDNAFAGAAVTCDVGGFSNCLVMNPNGSLGAVVAAGFTGEGFILIPGVLHAYKASAADLAGYAAPVPEPETYALLAAGLGLLGWHARCSRRSGAKGPYRAVRVRSRYADPSWRARPDAGPRAVA